MNGNDRNSSFQKPYEAKALRGDAQTRSPPVEVHAKNEDVQTQLQIEKLKQDLKQSLKQKQAKIHTEEANTTGQAAPATN